MVQKLSRTLISYLRLVPDNFQIPSTTPTYGLTKVYFSWGLWGSFTFRDMYVLRYILSWSRRYILMCLIFWDIFCHGLDGIFWDVFWDIFCHGSDDTFVRVKRLKPSKNFWLLRKAMNWFMPCQRKYKYRNVREEI